MEREVCRMLCTGASSTKAGRIMQEMTDANSGPQDVIEDIVDFIINVPGTYALDWHLYVFPLPLGKVHSRLQDIDQSCLHFYAL